MRKKVKVSRVQVIVHPQPHQMNNNYTFDAISQWDHSATVKRVGPPLFFLPLYVPHACLDPNRSHFLSLWCSRLSINSDVNPSKSLLGSCAVKEYEV